MVKTDGRYLYLLYGNKLSIVEAGDKMSLIGTLTLKEESHSQPEMYVDGDRLIIPGSRQEYEKGNPSIQPQQSQEDVTVESCFPMPDRSFTFVHVYDIEDPSRIKSVRSFEVEGDMVTSRKKDDYFYLLSRFSSFYLDESRSDPRPFIGEDGDLSPIPLRDIMVSPDSPSGDYLTLSAIHIQDSKESVQSETIVSAGDITYMSNEAMYVAGQTFSSTSKEVSLITKFSLQGGSPSYAGSGEVRGSLHNQFSMDEYEGKLRVATTSRWDAGPSQNNLFILDSNMQPCGSVQDFASGEQIYSVRFMGSRGYVVTFERIDPLFVFDLSDPKNPVITGELEVPGFSDYLHPVSEHVILGMGQEDNSMKLSLFDVSDMGKPKELDTLLMGKNSASELLYNHKAAMFHYDDEFLAFPLTIYDANWFGASLVSYEGNRLAEKGRISGNEKLLPQTSTDVYGFQQRLLYISDTLYYVHGQSVRSFDLDTLKETQTLSLK